MVQQLKDLAAKVKTDRKTWIFSIIGVLILGFLFFAPSGQKPQARKQVAKREMDTPKLASNEAYTDIVDRFRVDLEKLQSENAQIKDQSVQQKQALDEYQQRTAEIFKKMLEKMADNQNAKNTGNTGSVGSEVQLATTDSPVIPISANMSPQELESFGMDQQQIVPPTEPEPEKVAVIGAGDSVRVELLAGVNAPTDGTPYPVVFKLVSDVYGPDGSALPLGEARIVAASQGSITDQRALFRLTSMNVRYPDGRRKEFKVDGWVVGEDGIRGMSGVLIDPLGKALLGAGIAAGVQGFGQGLELNNTSRQDNGFLGLSTTTVTGSPLEIGAARGIQSMGREYSGIIRDRLAEMVPVIQVLSGRQSTAVFSRSVQIPGLLEQYDNKESDFVSE